MRGPGRQRVGSRTPHDPDPVRLHGQHLPFADGGGRHARARARGRTRARVRDRQRGHRLLAHGRPARPARDRGRLASRRHAGRRRAPGPPARLRGLRPAAGDGPREPDRVAHLLAEATPRARRGCCASSTRPPPARPTSTSPTRITAARTASRPCSTRSRPRAAACSIIFVSLERPCDRPPAATCGGYSGSAAATSTTRYRVQFSDESFAFVKTRADVAPGEYEAEAAGCAGSPSRARCACPRCWGGRRRARARLGRRGWPRQSGRVRRGPRRGPRGGAEAFGATPPTSPRAVASNG